MELLNALIPAFGELACNRRGTRLDHTVFYARSHGDVELYCTLISRDPEKVAIVAHPAVVGSTYSQVVALADEIAKSHSVVLFDFRGHGRSSGRLPLGFESVSRDLEAVVLKVRRMGFGKVGVAGFSLGAAAAMLLASRSGGIDALASIGCPPRFPALGPLEAHPSLSRIGLRVLGLRIDRSPDGNTAPVDVAADLPPIPKLVVFGEWEVVPPEEIAEFSDLIAEPKETLTVPGAWHADLGGREPLVREWFERIL